MKKNELELLRYIKRIRQLMDRVRSPYAGMSKQKIIEKIRETREKLWEEKFAAHSR